MSYVVRYQPRAGREYYSALTWYREKSIQTSINFSRALKDCSTAILKQPDRYKKTYKDFREISLKRFPFIVIYTIDEENKLLLVASIFHKKRNPKAKYRNLG